MMSPSVSIQKVLWGSGRPSLVGEVANLTYPHNKLQAILWVETLGLQCSPSTTPFDLLYLMESLTIYPPCPH